MRTEELLKNPSTFVPLWKGKWEPSPDMLDFEEKWTAFHTPRGRLMSCAHRGDRNEAYYPENSLEGFLAATMAGADILEADIHTTKDGVLIIMHDDTLTRTTNVSTVRKSNASLPDTDKVADWTFDEIRSLRLVDKNGNITEYAIPTLEELIITVKNRAFITLDKRHAYDFDKDVMALVYKHSAFRTVLIPYDIPFERVAAIEKRVFDDVGVYMPFFAKSIRGGGILDEERVNTAAKFLGDNGMSPILRCGGFAPEEYERHVDILAPFTSTHRIYGETLVDKNDVPENWQKMVDIGYNVIMGNTIYEMLKFVKEKEFK